MQQTLEIVTDSFHKLVTHDYNVDGTSEILISRIKRNNTEIGVIHPKELSNNYIKVNNVVNTLCIAQTTPNRRFDLVTCDHKGLVRINARESGQFFQKGKDTVRLPSPILCSASGDVKQNRISEVIVGCRNGEVVMIERILVKRNKWNIRGFTLGQIFQQEVSQIVTGDFSGRGRIGFIAGSRNGIFKQIEYRPQLQKFDLIGEFKVETEPSFCFSGDIDRDGVTEVMVGEYSGRFNIFKKNKLMSIHNLGVVTCGTVGDVDNDDQLEVVVGTAEGTFHILRKNTIESYEGYSNINDLFIGDINNNRQCDLIFSIDKKRIIAFNFVRDRRNEKPNIELLPVGGITSLKGQGQQAIPQQVHKAVEPTQKQQALCPNCQSEASYITQYRRWYCYHCQQYIQPIIKRPKKGTLDQPSQPEKDLPLSHAYNFSSTKSTTTNGQSSPQMPQNQQVKEVEAGLGEITRDLVWDEIKQEATESSEVNYFLPLDLEADINYSVKFFYDLLKVRHAFLIHSSSGVPLFSQSFGKDIDVSLISGFLSAVGTFTEEMAGESEKREGVFSELGREGFWIIIYEGKLSKVAFLVTEKLGSEFKERISLFLKEFEKKYVGELKDFSGFVSAFSGTMNILEKHLRLEYLYPLKLDTDKMRLTATTKNEKQIARAFLALRDRSDEEVFYITELIDQMMDDPEITLQMEDLFRVLIKYLENGMLIPIPPPPGEV